ncbi:MAG: hypothetical protein ACM3PP_07075 [Candidatus Saccharibacteria bacterium]
MIHNMQSRLRLIKEKLFGSIAEESWSMTLGAVFILSIGATVYLPAHSYNVDNYRYLISSVLQAMAAIFALTATVTILIFQVAHENSPQSLVFYPRKRHTITMVAFLALMFIDGILLAWLPPRQPGVILYKAMDVLLMLNAVAVIQVILNVGTIMRQLQPEETVKEIVEQAAKASTNEERWYVVQSLEELAVSMISKHRISVVRPILKAYADIMITFTQTRIDLNAGIINDINHPVREIPKSFWRVVVSLLHADIDNMMYNIADTISTIAVSCQRCEDSDFLGRHTCSIASKISEECLKMGKIDPAVNFVRHLPLPDEQESALALANVIKSIIALALDKGEPRLVHEALDRLQNLAEKYPLDLHEAVLEIIEMIKYDNTAMNFSDIYGSTEQQITRINRIIDNGQ